MSTKRCPGCGDEFIAAVTTCPDCGVTLLDAHDPNPPDDPRASSDGPIDPLPYDPRTVPPPTGDGANEIAYDLAEWSVEQREHLDRLLVDVPHVWQGTDLVVRAAAQTTVDPLIDDIDAGVPIGIGLDPVADRLAYDVGDLDDDQLSDLVDTLVAEDLPHEYLPDTDEIVVHEADEQQVEAVFDRFDFPDALPVDDGAGADGDEVDGLEVQEVLGDLFVAADRLRGDGADPEGLLGFFDAAQRLDGLALPYGFEQAEWDGLKTEITSLRLLIESDDASDDTAPPDDAGGPVDHPPLVADGSVADGSVADGPVAGGLAADRSVADSRVTDDDIAAAADGVRTLLRRYV